MALHSWPARAFAVFFLCFLPTRAGARPQDAAAESETRERRSMERFLSLLEKNPPRGTPLDRVHGYHVERGSLDEFIKSYRDRLDKKPGDGAAWLILGLLEFQREQDAAAVTALEQAEIHRAQDPWPPLLTGREGWRNIRGGSFTRQARGSFTQLTRGESPLLRTGSETTSGN
jgi:tetratricopeptide (TPR) repeat protein